MVRNSRSMPLDSGSMPLDEPRKLMKFSPEIPMGTLLQIGVIVAGAVMFTVTIKGELQAQKIEIEANKLAAQKDNQRTDEALKDLKTEVKDLKKSVDDIKEGVAILRGRAADTSRGSR